MGEERLQKLISRAGICARRKAEELIAAGLVTVNGTVASLGDKADPERDAIKVEGRRLPAPAPHRYLLLNKPAGYVSTVSDPEGRPTVLDLVPAGMRKALKPVGRLDFQTEGLLLLTTDGDFAQRIAHPRYGCTKTYEVKVRGVPDEGEIERIAKGMWIDGKRTRPADVRFLKRTKRGEGEGNSWWRVVIGEGRTRQVREMFFRTGHPVQKLRRVAIGGLTDSQLPRGEWRRLDDREVELLRRPSRSSASGGRTRRAPGGGSPERGGGKRRRGGKREGDGKRGGGGKRRR